MSIFDLRRTTYRALALFLVPGQVLLAVPVRANDNARGSALLASAVAGPAPAPEVQPAKPAPPPPAVRVNRTVPKVKPVPAYPLFSKEPTIEEIFRARVFEEPLVPVGGAPDSGQNRELAKAIETQLRSGRWDDLSTIEGFLEAHPATPWRASLLLNLGMVYRKAGFYTRALKAWDEVWALAKDQSDVYGRAVADRALGEWMEVSAQFGRIEPLQRMVEEIEGRDVGGSAGEKVEVGKEGLWFFQNHHEDAIPSGAAAVDRLLALGKPDYVANAKVQAFKGTHHGATLTEIAALAESVGLSMQVAYRNPDAEPPVRSVFHWKLGRFSAIVKVDKERGQYLVHDPVLGQEIWLSRRVLDEEGSGYYLLPAGAMPAGFRKAGEKEASQVRGKCGPKTPPPPSGNNM